MTTEAFNRLPIDVKGLIKESYSEYLSDGHQGDFDGFLAGIDWRVDSGLIYPDNLSVYNPQY